MRQSFDRVGLLAVAAVSLALVGRAWAAQELKLDRAANAKTFEGVGAVSGGGATSVLLKDYPEPQRSRILDLLFKPNVGAAMQTLYVEIGSDGNATQGTEPTHARTRGDANFYRGYEWWLMREAKRRNPQLTLDACAWGAPGWVGDGEFWSQDMADYYVAWIKGLKSAHGLDLDAVGCRNERGVVTSWAKTFRKTLDAAGLQSLRIHAFDNAGRADMWDWVADLNKDAELAAAVSIVGNHCLTVVPFPDVARQTISKFSKTVWNTEEHVYNSDGRSFADDYAVALGTLHLFNDNYLTAGATKVVNWYLVGSTYGIEPYADQPPPLIARSPWSGHFDVKPALWAYAHYGQFARVGWKYVDGGSAKLDAGGSVVTLAAPDGGDFSVIAETSGAKAAQQITLRRGDGLSTHALCVWRTTRNAAFARQPDVAFAADGTLSVTLEPDAIYSFSTTTGQQKGGVDSPADKPFPLPYSDDFEGYPTAKSVGYLPRYFADICGVFELADRRGGGHCLRQVVARKSTSWAPEWMPYTILGDAAWTNYEVSSDVSLDDGGWAGVMGRVSHTGNGWDGYPNGYYARLYPDGGVAIYLASDQLKGSHDRQLAVGNVPKWTWNGWHRLTLRFAGKRITLLVDGVETIHADDATFPAGMAGLVTGGEGSARNTAMFDNLRIDHVGGDATSRPTTQATRPGPLYDAK